MMIIYRVLLLVTLGYGLRLIGLSSDQGLGTMLVIYVTLRLNADLRRSKCLSL